MFRKLRQGEGLLFTMPLKMRIALHMLFVFKPIDVLILEKKAEGFKVIEKKEDFKPFTFYTSKKKSDTFLELPKGAAKDVQEEDFLTSQ